MTTKCGQFYRRYLGLAVLVLLAATQSLADQAVKGYIKKNGTYVAPYKRTDPNKTKNDNYSTKGNVNPYTGKLGTKPRDGEATNATTKRPILSPAHNAPKPARKRAELKREIAAQESIMERWVKQNSFSTPESAKVTNAQYEAAKAVRDNDERELRELPTDAP